jgi:hypothetical protein
MVERAKLITWSTMNIHFISPVIEPRPGSRRPNGILLANWLCFSFVGILEVIQRSIIGEGSFGQRPCYLDELFDKNDFVLGRKGFPYMRELNAWRFL